MSESESRDAHYLFKLKCTSKIKSLIKRHMENNDRWEYAGSGYEGVEDTIQLQGWSTARRVIIFRQKIKNKDVGVLTQERTSQKGQLTFHFGQIDRGNVDYDYAILITNLENEILTLAQHYRDRGDSENNFDELKNQWGWCGYTTQDLKRCKIIGKFIALIYDWWNIFTRLVDPDRHREAVTTRPQLLNATGKLTEHGRQRVLTITSTHAKTNKTKKILTAISAFFKTLQDTAEQLISENVLRRILEVAFRKFFGNCTRSPPNALLAPA